MSGVDTAVPVLSPWEHQYPAWAWELGGWGQAGKSRGAAGEMLQMGLSCFSHRHCLALLSSGTKVGGLGSDLGRCPADLHLLCQGLL